MGGVYTPNTNPTGSQDFQDYGLDSLSTGIAAGTAFDNAWNGFATTSSTLRGGALEEARLGRMQAAGGRFGFRQNPDTPIISKEEANEKYGIKGQLSFDQDIREGEAKLIHQYRQDQQKRDYVLSRSDPGVVNSAIRLGAGFAATALDPIGVATSLIPVVGEARFAAMAGRVGMTAARLSKGAIEGAVGAAVVEPLAYMQAQTEHADYTAYDSLVNIAFGGALGVGLQGAGVVLGKFINRQTPEAKQAALNGALAAVMENRPVTVGDVFRFEASRNTTLRASSTLSRAPSPIQASDLAGGLPPIARLEQIDQAISSAGTPDAAPINITQLSTERVNLLDDIKASIPEPVREAHILRALARTDSPELKAATVKIAKLDAQIEQARSRGKEPDAKVLKERSEAVRESERLLPEEEQERLIKEAAKESQAPEKVSDQDTIIQPTAKEPIDQVIREMLENSKRSMAPDPQLTAQIIKIADRTSKMKEAPTFEAAKAEATQLDTDVNEMLSMYDLSEKDMAEVSAPKDDIDPDSYTKAVKQAFACMVA